MNLLLCIVDKSVGDTIFQMIQMTNFLIII